MEIRTLSCMTAASIHAFAAGSAKSELRPFDYSPAPLGEHDIDVRITHCGICHSDVHLVDNDWGLSAYPLVPGHEIVGVVEAIGGHVRHLAKGDRIGIGWQRNACLHCFDCFRGADNLCAQTQATCLGNFGGFADRVRTSAEFAFRIPKELDSAATAPLLCGGITVYSPLRQFGATPASRVGVIGIGGLGHLAIKFARAMGCEVTAFSTSPSKRHEAQAMGAHRFVVPGKAGAGDDPIPSSLDLIISTAMADLDWSLYMQLLRPDGVFALVGVPPNPPTLQVFPMLMGRRSFAASPIGSRWEIMEMLEFAARHGIGATIETMPFAKASEALDRVRKGTVRYRMVLTA
jgi:uncharacterized zinc-type alcohol dehydrogenase-like protein